MSIELQEIEKAANFNIQSKDDPKIMVIGVGGGGNNAINNMYNQNIESVKFVVCNTDSQALENSPVPDKLLIGPNTTGGLGAGNIPEVARAAAEESIDDIKYLFTPELKMVFVTAGMGGGTGTGAAPVVARAAKEKGLLTIGIVTIPFLFEGTKKISKALDGADEMSKNVDALLVINNERLNDIYGDLTFLNAFGKADDTLTTAARSISELITKKGYMNLDFNDVDTTLRNGGAAIISSGYGEGENRVTEAFQSAIKSPLLKNRDILTAKKLLFNIYFAAENVERPFTMNETKEITSFVTSINSGVDIIWGATIDNSLGEKVKITILAAGFELTLHEEDEEEDSKSVSFTPETTPSAEDEERIRKTYGTKKVENLQREKDTKRYVALTPDLMDDDEVIELLEKVSTYNRDKETTEKLNTRVKASVEGGVAEVEKSQPADNSEGQVVNFF